MSEIYLVDSHTHLEEIKDLDQALTRARNYGVVAIVTVGSDYESNHRALEIAEKYQPLVYAALGSHPWDTGACLTTLDRNLQFIQDNLKNAVAIGEVGLDYHKEVLKKGSKEQQKYVLSNILKIGKEKNWQNR